MLNLINIDKPITVNGQLYPNSMTAYAALKDFTGDIKIEFGANTTPQQPSAEKKVVTTTVAPVANVGTEYRVNVRQYMIKPATPQFDFHTKWNNDKPMPMRVMVGVILEETKGMYKMKLHGRPEPSSTCLHCGRGLTNKISMIYGLGPICGQHFYVSPYETAEEVEAAMDAIRARMAEITWEGWVIKSAILSMDKVDSTSAVAI